MSARLGMNLDRYARQIRFAPLGEDGQRRLGQGRAVVCGCGALGSALANLLVRAGVGVLRIVDRDFVELGNLARQTLFDEADAREALPKAVAAARKLEAINSAVRVEPVVADLDAGNVEELCREAGVILDGTDNFETRFLINDAAVKLGIPWVYGGCIGAEGRMLVVLPGEGPCLRCLDDCPPPGAMPTCETAGILGPAAAAIASLEAMEAIKILAGRREAVTRRLTVMDLWNNVVRQLDPSAARCDDCPTCGRRLFPALCGAEGSRPAVLCGRNAVQLRSRGGICLETLAQELSKAGPVTRNPFLVRLAAESYELTIFADGRAIVSGTNDPAVARTVYARYVG